MNQKTGEKLEILTNRNGPAETTERGIGNEKELKKGKQEIGNKKDTRKWGIWNTRSLAGKEIALVNEFERADLEILVLPETKKKGQGILETENQHLLIWSGIEESKRAQAGVGCLIHKNIKQKLSKWRGISERILLIELKYRTQVETIIAVYGPSEDEKTEIKDKFWEELGITIEAAEGDIFLIGDFNARVGKANNIYKVIGKYGEEVRNNNGRRLLDLCVVYDLMVANTFYEHKDINKYTREEHARKEKSIIDYIIVEKENRSALKDVAVKRGFEINSDHYLVVTKLKQNEHETKKLKERNGKVNLETIKSYKLKNEHTAKLYKKKVDEELGKVQDRISNMDLEEIWTVFRNVIIQAARDTCGIFRRSNIKKQTAWWTDEIKEQVKSKKQKWHKYLSNKTEKNYQAYKQQRLVVKNLVMQSKQKTWTEFGEKLEKDSKSNQKLFFRVLKKLRNNDSKINVLTLKNKQGETLNNEVDVMNRWREYFQELLNVEHETEINEIELNKGEESLNNNEGNITMEELMEAIRELKNGKAPGADKITTEMMKAMGEQGKKVLLELFKRVWIGEIMPREWEVGLILPLFKKGDVKDCNNYRGITLISTIVKLLEKILEKRLRIEIEPTLSEAQSGFRKGRCIQDHVFSIKEIIGRTLTTGKEAYIAFIDMEKAFDRTPRRKIWKCLQERNINKKLTRVIKCMYKETRNRVISKNALSSEFKTKEGVRQGGSLSPLLFVIFMDKIIKEVEGKIKPLYIGYRYLERVGVSECAFADDVAIITGSEKDLKENLKVWNEALKHNGKKMNIKKTKVMVISKENRTIEVTMEDEKLEQVSNFQYLGVTLEGAGKHDIELNNRIGKANKVYFALNKGLLKRKEVSRKTKMNVYKAIYRPILTYGCESWVLTKREMSKIRATEMKYLRKVGGVTKMDSIKNEDIRKDLEIDSIEEFIEKRIKANK